MSERIPSLDVLRFLGLLAIFMAHTLTGDYALQVVSFDVVLLVLVSGATASLGHQTQQSGGSYFIKRCVRLLAPAWVFLTAYFIVGLLLHKNFSLFKVFTFYSLLTDWYVWIIRVFLIIALLASLLYKFNALFRHNGTFLIVMSVCFIVFDFCTVNLQTVFPVFDTILLFKYVLYLLLVCVPYLFVYLIGLRLKDFTTKQILIYSIILISGFVILGIFLYQDDHVFVRTDLYKYPPRVYYICYSLGVSLLIWLGKDVITKWIYKFKWLSTMVSFIGQNTIWIYFWHILFLDYIPGISQINDWLRFILITIASVFFYSLQFYVINKVLLPKIKNTDVKKQVKRIMCG